MCNYKSKDATSSKIILTEPEELNVRVEDKTDKNYDFDILSPFDI